MPAAPVQICNFPYMCSLNYMFPLTKQEMTPTNICAFNVVTLTKSNVSKAF